MLMTILKRLPSLEFVCVENMLLPTLVCNGSWPGTVKKCRLRELGRVCNQSNAVQESFLTMKLEL